MSERQRERERRRRRTERDAAVKLARRVHEVQVGLAVVALARLVDFGLGEEEQVGARLVPLHLDLVGLVERLAARGDGERREAVDLDRRRCALLLGDKEGEVRVGAGRDRDARDALEPDLVGDAGRPVGRVVHVHLVGDAAHRLGLVGRVLKRPASEETKGSGSVGGASAGGTTTKRMRTHQPSNDFCEKETSSWPVATSQTRRLRCGGSPSAGLTARAEEDRVSGSHFRGGRGEREGDAPCRSQVWS